MTRDSFMSFFLIRKVIFRIDFEKIEIFIYQRFLVIKNLVFYPIDIWSKYAHILHLIKIG